MLHYVIYKETILALRKTKSQLCNMPKEITLNLCHLMTHLMMSGNFKTHNLGRLKIQAVMQKVLSNNQNSVMQFIIP